MLNCFLKHTLDQLRMLRNEENGAKRIKMRYNSLQHIAYKLATNAIAMVLKLFGECTYLLPKLGQKGCSLRFGSEPVQGLHRMTAFISPLHPSPTSHTLQHQLKKKKE